MYYICVCLFVLCNRIDYLFIVTLMKPHCANLYNLFHQNDPSALRIEPLLSARFSYIPPVNVPRYQKFPLGDGQPIYLRMFVFFKFEIFFKRLKLIIPVEYLQTYSYLFTTENVSQQSKSRRISDISISSNNSPIENLNLPNISLCEYCLSTCIHLI